MPNNPITDEQLAELNRLHEAATKGMNWQEVAQFQAMITEQYQPLRQRLLAAESRLRAVVNDLGEVLVDVRRQRDAATARAKAAEKEALDYIDYRNQAVISRNAMERRLEAAESLVAGLRGALDDAGDLIHACVCETEEIRGKVCHSSCIAINTALALTPASAGNWIKAEAYREAARLVDSCSAETLHREADRLTAEAEKEAANG